MAKLETEHIFKGTLPQVFAGIKKYDLYPQYLPGVTYTEILEPKEKGSSCRVRYEINLVKTFYYVLDMFEEYPHRVRWQLAESNLMKFNSGSWEFPDSQKAKGKTHAIYRLEVKFKGLVPAAVTDRIAKANLPALFEGFQKLIDLKD